GIRDDLVTGVQTCALPIFEEKPEDIERRAEDASVIKLVDQILQEAIQQRATDIHIEPDRDELAVRYRVDGVLYDTRVSPDIKYRSEERRVGKEVREGVRRG